MLLREYQIGVGLHPLLLYRCLFVGLIQSLLRLLESGFDTCGGGSGWPSWALSYGDSVGGSA
jgi:hypothetical protein